MNTTNDIASITALVPYVYNNERVNDIIPFKVYQKEGAFIAIPFIPDADRKKMNLSEQISFKVINNRIVPISEQHHDVIYNIVSELRLLHIV
jgi:hypothetical protein